MTDRIATARKRIEEAVGVEPLEPMPGYEDGELTLARAVIELAAVLESTLDRTLPRYTVNPAHRNGRR